VPVFDRSASRPGRAEANLLRSVLGPAKRRSTSFHQASRDYRWRQRRASVTRALIVFGLIGLFCGSAVMMGAKLRPPPDAARAFPPGTAQTPFPAPTPKRSEHPSSAPASQSAPPPLDDTSHRLRLEYVGDATAGIRLVGDANTSSGALHG
jgi:hypothetical protein